MKGHQLVTIKKTQKNKPIDYLQSPIGFIQGTSEELHSLSPKARKIRNQIYLKSISPAQLNLESRGSQDLSLLKSFHPRSESTSNSVHYSIPNPKPEKLFKYDPNSNFSQHFYEEQEKLLLKLSQELFPKELSDQIQYLPDYTPSVIVQQRTGESSHRSSSSQAAPDSWKISNLYRNRGPDKKLNEGNLKHSSFSTYSTAYGEFYPRFTRGRMKRTRKETEGFLPKVCN